jgi:outer membrane protein
MGQSVVLAGGRNYPTTLWESRIVMCLFNQEKIILIMDVLNVPSDFNNKNEHFFNKFRHWRNKAVPTSFTLLISPLLCGTGHAETLSSLLDRARSNEPTYLSAKATVQAARARTDQALGELLPQINVSANVNYNDRDYQTRSPEFPPTHNQFDSNSQQISLTQPIWKRPSYIGLEQAENATFQAEQQLANTEQELLARLVSAWFDLLGARDQVIFTQRQTAVAQYRWEEAGRGLELDYISQPEAYDVQSKLDQAKSEEISAETDLHLKRAALEQIVGNLDQLPPAFMREDAELADLSSEKLKLVLANVEAGNHNIQAAIHAHEAASDEVRKQLAGHQPTLDLVASYGKNSQAVGGFPGQAGYDIILGTVGLQFNMPIYSGGTQSARVVEAVAQKDKARFDIEAARNSSMLSAKEAWYGWYSAYSKNCAAVQSIKAANSALRAASVAAGNGLKFEVAILESQLKLSEARRDYNKSRYDQVVNLVKLKAIMGVLTNEDIAALDALFVDKPADDSASATDKVTKGFVECSKTHKTEI